MRALITLLLLTLLALPAVAADYGEKLSDAGIVPVSSLLEQPDQYVGKTVKIEGRIAGVCAHRGCWIEIAGDKDFQSLRVKVDDGVIVFPVEAMGHMATVEGVFTRLELTPEQADAQHKATCEKEEGASCQHAAATQGGVAYQIAGLGAVIAD